MIRLCAFLLVPLLLLAAATGARADPVTIWASQNDVGPGNSGFGNYSTIYDNFTLGAGATIGNVLWQGGYFGTQTPPPSHIVNGGPYPPVGFGISQFTIKFYANNANNQPNTNFNGIVPLPQTNALASFTVPFSQSHETFVTANEFNNSITPPDQHAVYNYSASLGSPLTLGPGTYWMSIVADMPVASPDFLQWGWHTGVGGDNRSFNDFGLTPQTMARFLNPNDQAFTLTTPGGNVISSQSSTIPGSFPSVPEPSSLAAWGLLGLGGLAYRWRRSRRPA